MVRYIGVVIFFSFLEVVEIVSCYKIYGNVKFFVCTLYIRDFLGWELDSVCIL